MRNTHQKILILLTEFFSGRYKRCRVFGTIKIQEAWPFTPCRSPSNTGLLYILSKNRIKWNGSASYSSEKVVLPLQIQWYHSMIWTAGSSVKRAQQPSVIYTIHMATESLSGIPKFSLGSCCNCIVTILLQKVLHWTIVLDLSTRQFVRFADLQSIREQSTMATIGYML